MIGLAVLEYFSRKIGGRVGEQWFYENLPIDEDGAMTNYGVYLTTDTAEMVQMGDDHQFFTFYVAIGEGAKDPQTGEFVAEKQDTDRLASSIQRIVADALGDPESCHLVVAETGEEFSDVRILPAQSKARTITLSNGAIVKQVVCEVYYKVLDKKGNQ